MTFPTEELAVLSSSGLNTALGNGHAHELDRHNLIVGGAEDALHWAVGLCFDCSDDITQECGLLSARGRVHNRHICHRYSEGLHLDNRLRSACGR